jgi:hypothetical protein
MSSFEIKQKDILVTSKEPHARARASIQHGVEGAISSKHIACFC